MGQPPCCGTLEVLLGPVCMLTLFVWKCGCWPGESTRSVSSAVCRHAGCPVGVHPTPLCPSLCDICSPHSHVISSLKVVYRYSKS